MFVTDIDTYDASACIKRETLRCVNWLFWILNQSLFICLLMMTYLEIIFDKCQTFVSINISISNTFDVILIKTSERDCQG